MTTITLSAEQTLALMNLWLAGTSCTFGSLLDSGSHDVHQVYQSLVALGLAELSDGTILITQKGDMLFAKQFGSLFGDVNHGGTKAYDAR